MKGEGSWTKEDQLDHLLREALTREALDGKPSGRVVTAVMARVFAAAPARGPLPLDTLVLALLIAGSLAWAAGRFLTAAIPALRSVMGLVWWRLGESVILRVAHDAYAVVSALVALDFGAVFHVILLLPTLVVIGLSVLWQIRATEN